MLNHALGAEAVQFKPSRGGGGGGGARSALSLACWHDIHQNASESQQVELLCTQIISSADKSQSLHQPSKRYASVIA